MTICDEFWNLCNHVLFFITDDRRSRFIQKKKKSSPPTHFFSTFIRQPKISRRAKKWFFFERNFHEDEWILNFWWNFEFLKFLFFMLEKKWKMWKRREREKMKIEGIWTEKIFWSSWEKRVNFKWFDPLSKLKSLKFEFFETLEKTFFRLLEGWRRIEENRTIRILGFFREIPFQWRIH